MQDAGSDDPYAPENLLGYVDWFVLHDRRLLERSLEGLEDIEATGRGEWTWHGGSSANRRIVAELAIERDLLALETYTEGDADRCRSRLERLAGSAVEFMIGQESYKLWGIDYP